MDRIVRLFVLFLVVGGVLYYSVQVDGFSGSGWVVTAVEPAAEPALRPAIYENRVVWLEWIPLDGMLFQMNLPRLTPPELFKVMVYDLETGQLWDLDGKFPDCDFYSLDTYGDWIISEQHCFARRFGVYGYNYMTDEFLEIAVDENGQMTHVVPAIDANHVVYVQSGGCCTNDVRLFDLDTRTTINITGDGYETVEYSLDTSGDWVVWSASHQSGSDIYAYNLATTESITVTDNMAVPDYLRVDENVIVWTDLRNDEGDIWAYDLTSRKSFIVAEGPGKQSNQSIYGNLIFWTENQKDDWKVLGFDRDSGEYFEIFEVRPEFSIGYPTVSYGERVIWRQDSRNPFDWQLFSAKRWAYQSYLPVILRP